jgi:hypothetical protein
VLGRTGVLKGSSGCLNTGSWCFLLVGARETRELVLEKPGGWCFLLVGARENRESVLSASCSLQKQRL